MNTPRLYFAIALFSLASLSCRADTETPDSIHTVCETPLPDSESPLDHAVSYRLTEDDYREAAEKIGVEVAVIKAVVEIEAGKSHNGFHTPGQPLVNFDLPMFRRAAKRHGINLSKYGNSHRIVFNRPNAKRYGSYQGAQQARLDAAISIDSVAAIDGTFWGMFQIGGFNWKKCGAESRKDFMERMSRSEHDQLDLFINFIIEGGMDKFLRDKNWRAFARRYNGPSYAKRGYHTRLAKAYAKFKKEAQQ